MIMKKLLSTLSLLILTLGLAPFNSMAQSQTELWGMTNEGGNGMGVIFNTDANGNNQEVMHMFLENPGVNPQGTLCQASNGKFYGTTWLGGLRNMGLIFEYDPVTNIYKKIVDFTGTESGSNPAGSLIKAINGKLYGMTTNGGINNMGVLFEFDPTSYLFIKKYDFDGANHGCYPLGSLLEASNAKLYAITWRGGVNDKGVLFEFDLTTGTCEKKIDFDGVAMGSKPQGNLIQAMNGKLYGTTFEGGLNDAGVFFEYDYSSNSYKKLHEFNWTKTGANPMEGLIQSGNGKIYGTTTFGGAYDNGVFFEYDISVDTLIKRFDFDGASTGRVPYGRLMQSTGGGIWGMTVGGGENGAGVIYEYDLSGSIFNKKYDFIWSTGCNPRGGLVQADNGKLYGMTYSGGDFSSGTLFEVDTATNTYTTRINLNGSLNGRNLYGSLISDSKGDLYGLTVNGGLNNMGVLFKFDRANHSYIKKIDFDGAATGSYPRGSLMLASDGKFYSTTGNGGLNDLGALFEYDPKHSVYAKKFDFTWNVDGSSPTGKLVEVAGGKLYGVTMQGGNYDYGVIFEYDLSANTYSKKHDFNPAVSGGYPYNGMVLVSNGKLYGMTNQGGTNGMGVLYEFDPTNGTFTKKIDFDGMLGMKPSGTLIEAGSGKLYGMTREGGAYGMGVLFEYDFIADTCKKKVDFSGSANGRIPLGSLLQASNGKLYGMTSYGGLTDDGVLFEYDPVTNLLIKKLDFNALNGKNPAYTELIEVCEYPKFTSSAANVTVCPGASAVFNVATNGNNLSYQWQVNDGSGFTDIFNNTIYADVTNDTLHIISAAPGMNTYQYRCVATSACPAISIFSDTVVLTVNPVYTYTELHSLCNGQTYSWHGQSLTAEGTYYDNHTSTNGCDSNYTLTLTVNPVFAFTENHEMCNGETYNWQGTDISAEGTYTSNYYSVSGCDSIYTLNLTINTVDVSITVNDPVITANAIGSIYQWLDCDNAFASISAATSQSYTATQNGNYAVLIQQGSCSDTSVSAQIINVGITSFPLERMVIYPNPTSYELIIEMKGNKEKINFEILNANGQVVFNGNLVEKTTVQTSKFAPGVYLIKLENEKTLVIKKIIKE
jgi:uncharacterized repeat protein (TIGR03803 family)